ncbi:hypothetical protein [Nocardia sp. CC201C]|uniref:hypothetical protein n=1 Tax=Nocardia sp. CC201C TaxID=3044575 RepID=UPI0024A8E0D7|nr:hypothetical protein [Nocardia sp. CC201C]
MSMDERTSRGLRDQIQPIAEAVAAKLGAGHPAVAALELAAAEIAAAVPMPRRYADYEPQVG